MPFNDVKQSITNLILVCFTVNKVKNDLNKAFLTLYKLFLEFRTTEK